MARRGGARSGAGRPSGLQKKMALTVDQYVRRGYAKLPTEITPLSVMLDNMEFYHTKTKDLGMELLEALRQRGATPDQLLQLYAMFNDTREKSQSCAVGAAPYCHPRLSMTTIKTFNFSHFSDADLLTAIQESMPNLDLDELAKEIDAEFEVVSK